MVVVPAVAIRAFQLQLAVLAVAALGQLLQQVLAQTVKVLLEELLLAVIEQVVAVVVLDKLVLQDLLDLAAKVATD
jgi:hypothetical protein